MKHVGLTWIKDVSCLQVVMIHKVLRIDDPLFSWIVVSAAWVQYGCHSNFLGWRNNTVATINRVSNCKVFVIPISKARKAM